MDKYEKAIDKAKEWLGKNPRDQDHDLAHHEAVWKNCQLILEHEEIELDKKLLKVACYWHDVMVGEEKSVSRSIVDETCEYLSNLLDELGYSEREISVVALTVRHHEFRDRPRTIEGLVLQDADKLDVLSPARWKRFLDAYNSGKITRDKFESYIRTFFEWVPILSATFHYGYSRARADRAIDEFRQDASWKEMIDELGMIDVYKDSDRQMGSVKTRVIRILIRSYNAGVKIMLVGRSSFYYWLK